MLKLGKPTKGASCWNSASRLVTDKETRGRVVKTWQVDLFRTETRGRVVGTRQVDLLRTRRQEGELLKLGNPTLLELSRLVTDKETRGRVVKTASLLDKETRGRVVKTRQVDLLRTRRQEGELLKLGKTCLGQGDKRASCWNSASRLLLRTRRQEGELLKLGTRS